MQGPTPNPPRNDQRFISELEFVQCLASPSYIHCKIRLPTSNLTNKFEGLLCSSNKYSTLTPY